MKTYQQPRPSRAKQQYEHFLGTVRGLAPTLLLFHVPRILGSDPSQVLQPSPVSNTDGSGT